jgi:hypothetical protein
MAAEVMYGPQYAKQFVNDYLSVEMPTRLVRYRNAWNLSSGELPDIEDIFAYEPLAMDKWPTIITVAISTKSLTRIGFNATNNPEYNVIYAMRTYVWARSDGAQDTTLMRDRLTTVVRSALMDNPCLKRSNPAREAIIEESSINEEYSELTLLKGDRYLAGAYIGYDLRIEEVIERENLGIVSEIGLEWQNPSDWYLNE